MQSYSLFEINEYIRQVVALNFAEALWVRAEIAQLNESNGHWYLDLVQRAEETEELIARANAVIWKRSYSSLKKKIKLPLEQILVEGNEICCKARVEFHERYGYKLVIEDIDEDFTLGKIIAQRQVVLQRLQDQKLLHVNAALSLPVVMQKVAIISSVNAAGLQDFSTHLAQNPFGYAFQVQLFPAMMQGDRAASSMAQQLARITTVFDAVVIIRGGGARLDLSAFDEYILGKAIAECPTPVITGIGHDVDETVADKVAHTALKTPTAVADFILYHNAQFEGELEAAARRVGEWAFHRLEEKTHYWDVAQQNIRFLATQIHQKAQRDLDQVEFSLNNQVQHFLQHKKNELSIQNSKLETLDWQPTLERGFALVTKNGERINSTQQLSSHDLLNIRFKDGEITVEVKSET